MTTAAVQPEPAGENLSPFVQTPRGYLPVFLELGEDLAGFVVSAATIGTYATGFHPIPDTFGESPG